MNSELNPDNFQTLRPGSALVPADAARLWRVQRGVVGVLQAAGGDGERTQFIALPGDLVGAETLAGHAATSQVLALTEATLEAVHCADDVALRDMLLRAYGQARRQGREMLQLRTGSLTDRVKQMLLLLGAGGAGGAETDLELPSLRRLADILDSTPEGVCRVLSRMRQLDVVVARRPMGARVATRALSDLVPPPGMTSSLRGFRLAPLPVA